MEGCFQLGVQGSKGCQGEAAKLNLGRLWQPLHHATLATMLTTVELWLHANAGCLTPASFSPHSPDLVDCHRLTRLLSFPPTLPAAPLTLQVNSSQVCSWVLSVNSTSPAANDLGPFCSHTLSPAQQQAVVLGRCLTAPRFKLEVRRCWLHAMGGLSNRPSVASYCALAENCHCSPDDEQFVHLLSCCMDGCSIMELNRTHRCPSMKLTPYYLALQAPPGNSTGADGTMARTIGLSVGMVLLAACIGLGLAWYFVKKIKKGNSSSAPWGPSVSGSNAGRHGGSGRELNGGTASRYGIGGNSFETQQGAFRARAAALGHVSGTQAPGGGGIALAAGNGGPAGVGIGRMVPANVRQPPLEDQLQTQQQQVQQLQTRQQQQPFQQAGTQQQPAVLAPLAPRLHQWRPVVPRPSARESPFASLLEDDEVPAARGQQVVGEGQASQGQLSGQQQPPNGGLSHQGPPTQPHTRLPRVQ